MTITDVHQAARAIQPRPARVYVNPTDALRLIHLPMAERCEIVPSEDPTKWVPHAVGLDWYEDDMVPVGTWRFE